MKVTVWDTYVQKLDGTIMHFDIIVPEEETNASRIFQYGQEYLKGKHVHSKILTSKECKRCHVEEATDEINKSIKAKAYHIVEIDNCTP